MKRLISIVAALCLCTTFALADDDEGDFYDDGYVYEQNGAGDRFLKINLMANFPVNFVKFDTHTQTYTQQLYVGGAVDVGYYQFLTSQFAVGGEVLVGYNVTIGRESLVIAPITFGAMFQPVIGNFEFPITAGIGITTTSCYGETYFPGFAAKISAGAFYRLTEMWSLGLYGTAFWLPQWFVTHPQEHTQLDKFFTTAGIGARYHF